MALFHVDGFDDQLYKEEDLQYWLQEGIIPSDTWVCRAEGADVQWKSLADALGAQASDAGGEIGVGSACEGLYAADGQWYPGVVLSIDSDGRFAVQFDGYGEPELCEEVRAKGGASASAAVAAEASSDGTDPRFNDWYVLTDEGEQEGPFNLDDIRAKVDAGQNNFISNGGPWTPMGEVVGAVKGSRSGAAQAQPFQKGAAEPSDSQTSAGSAKDFVRKQTRRRLSTQRRSSLMSSRKKKSGNDSTSWNEANAMECCQWVETILGRSVAADADAFQEVLTTQTAIFCELFNTFIPGTLRKPTKSKLKFKRMENVTWFVAACRSILNMSDTVVISPNDVVNGKNMGKVIVCLSELSRLMRSRFPPDDAPPLLTISRK